MSLIAVKAFWGLWFLTINIFSMESRDMSISLWDLQVIGGIPADGVYYEEVIGFTR